MDEINYVAVNIMFEYCTIKLCVARSRGRSGSRSGRSGGRWIGITSSAPTDKMAKIGSQHRYSRSGWMFQWRHHITQGGIRRDFINQRHSVRRVGWSRPDEFQEVTHGLRAFLSAENEVLSGSLCRGAPLSVVASWSQRSRAGEMERREDLHRSEGGSSELI